MLGFLWRFMATGRARLELFASGLASRFLFSASASMSFVVLFDFGLGVGDLGLASLGFPSARGAVDFVLVLLGDMVGGEVGGGEETGRSCPPRSFTLIFFAPLLLIFSSSSEEG